MTKFQAGLYKKWIDDQQQPASKHKPNTGQRCNTTAGDNISSTAGADAAGGADEETTDGFVPLSMEHILSAWLVLAVGWTLSLLTFLAEIVGKIQRSCIHCFFINL